jgi:isopentenyldiphosphate isomerase
MPQPDFAQDPDELFDVVTEDGLPTGVVKRRADVHRDGDWHRAIHVWVCGIHDGQPFLLLNLRGPHKDTWPGRLDVTVGGHLAAGEGVDQAFREIDEEIGIVADPANLHYLETRKAYGLVERELQDVFLYRDDRPLDAYRPNPAELEGLVRVPVGDALTIFSERVAAAHANVLDATTRDVRPFVISGENLLPSQYFDYYLDVTQAIDRLLRDPVRPIAAPADPRRGRP